MNLKVDPASDELRHRRQWSQVQLWLQPGKTPEAGDPDRQAFLNSSPDKLQDKLFEITKFLGNDFLTVKSNIRITLLLVLKTKITYNFIGLLNFN